MTDEVQTTWGFWVGIWTGLLVGTFIGGITLIGQGVWETGRLWGEAACELRHNGDRQ